MATSTRPWLIARHAFTRTSDATISQYLSLEEIVRDRNSSVKGDEPSNVLFDTWLTARAAIALLDGALAGTGLDAEDFAVYSVLRQAGEISPGELARWMSAPATTVSSHVKRLVARGHVRQVPHPEDRRSYRITLTDAGEHAHTTAGRLFSSALASVEAALPRPASDVQQALRDLHAAIGAAAQRA